MRAAAASGVYWQRTAAAITAATTSAETYNFNRRGHEEAISWPPNGRTRCFQFWQKQGLASVRLAWLEHAGPEFSPFGMLVLWVLRDAAPSSTYAAEPCMPRPGAACTCDFIYTAEPCMLQQLARAHLRQVRCSLHVGCFQGSVPCLPVASVTEAVTDLFKPAGLPEHWTLPPTRAVSAHVA